MARTSLLWTTGQAKGVMEFDAVEIEAPQHEATITQYPVELGVQLVDHVRPNPITLGLTVWVSNTPVRVNGLTHMNGLEPSIGIDVQVREALLPPQLPSSIIGLQLSQEATVRANVRVWGGGVQRITRLQNIYNELKKAWAEARLFTVASDIGDFENMVLQRIGFQRTAQMAQALRFELGFQQITTAKLESEDISALFIKTESAKPKKDAGKQQTAPADEKTAEEAESALHLLAPDFGTSAGNVLRGLLGG